MCCWVQEGYEDVCVGEVEALRSLREPTKLVMHSFIVYNSSDESQLSLRAALRALSAGAKGVLRTGYTGYTVIFNPCVRFFVSRMHLLPSTHLMSNV